MNGTATEFKLGDYKTPLKIVWCPGCGDFGVLVAIQRALVAMQIPPEKVAIVSGIGCSSRLPGYVATYGFNGVHGRSVTVATGLKAARPDLTVIVTGGDGDGVSIGAGHFQHAARRNANLTYVMMDNQIYGLTKGQVAPTTPEGDKTKTTIYGNPDRAVDPCELAIACGATFVARSFSADMKGQIDIIVDAIKHNGFAFINIISPCVTFRGDDQFKYFKPLLKPLPPEHNPSDRLSALRFCQEEGRVSTGILYRTERASMVDQEEKQKQMAGYSPGKPKSIEDIIKNFIP